MLSRQDRGERAWHQQDAAWHRQMLGWALADYRWYESEGGKRAAAMAAVQGRELHRAAMERSRHYGQPGQSARG